MRSLPRQFCGILTTKNKMLLHCMWVTHRVQSLRLRLRLSNFRNESKLKDGSFILTGRSFQIVGPQTLNDLGPHVTGLVLIMYSCPEVTDRNCLRLGNGYRRNYDAVGCQIRKCQSIQTSIHQSGDLENYPLSHWQPMKVAQHWRDVIVFPSTSDEPCCRVLNTLQTWQEFPADTVQ